MPVLDPLVLWVHLIFSSIWVGGSIFLGLVLAPLLKKMIPDINKRISFMVVVGRRFNYLGGSSLLLLVITGIYNARSFLGQSELLFDSTYGLILLTKIILVSVMIVVYFIHIRILSKDVELKILQQNVPEEYFVNIRKNIILLGRLTVALAVGILLLSALLDRGGI